MNTDKGAIKTSGSGLFHSHSALGELSFSAGRAPGSGIRLLSVFVCVQWFQNLYFRGFARGFGLLDVRDVTIASASISTSISGETNPPTWIMAVAGRILPKNSP